MPGRAPKMDLLLEKAGQVRYDGDTSVTKYLRRKKMLLCRCIGAQEEQSENM